MPKLLAIGAIAAVIVMSGGVCGATSVQEENPRDRVLEHDLTNFPLTGRHRTVPCGDCHLEGVLEGTPTECEVCHWTRRQDDRYNLQLGLQCGNCHTTQDWARVDPGLWNHATATGFELKGSHASAECLDCHTSGKFAGQSPECIACHQSDYDSTRNPNHRDAGFPTNCESCHGDAATGWEGAQFDHTSFVLKGQHQSAACSDCHSSGVYAGLASDCVACHQSDYNATVDPNHQQAGFPTDCEGCHGDSATTWEGAEIDHSSFILKGQHQSAACTDCHSSGVYAGLASDCVACHQSDYNATVDPNHQQAGFPTDCESCHGDSAATWEGAEIDHSSFILKGQHQSAACSDCHSSGVYAGLASDCVACHQSDYNATVDPNHQQAGFPTDCEGCHGDSAVTWEGAQINHDQFWPLRGAHTNLDCSQCHEQGYSLPQECFGCHAADYSSTSDPNHQSAGFPTTCETCHFPGHITWNQAVFSHDFPIQSGKHSNLECSDCHLTANFLQFSCLDCHEHEKEDMDDKHKEETGYTYESGACYSCHPQGSD